MLIHLIVGIISQCVENKYQIITFTYITIYVIYVIKVHFKSITIVSKPRGQTAVFLSSLPLPHLLPYFSTHFSTFWFTRRSSIEFLLLSSA